MEQRNERIEERVIREESSVCPFNGALVVTNDEVGTDQVVLRIEATGGPSVETPLKVGHSRVYDSGGNGRFKISLLAIKDGEFKGDIPASAWFLIIRV
jgi:hypothetical protein